MDNHSSYNNIIVVTVLYNTHTKMHDIVQTYCVCNYLSVQQLVQTSFYYFIFLIQFSFIVTACIVIRQISLILCIQYKIVFFCPDMEDRPVLDHNQHQHNESVQDYLGDCCFLEQLQDYYQCIQIMCDGKQIVQQLSSHIYSTLWSMTKDTECQLESRELMSWQKRSRQHMVHCNLGDLNEAWFH